MATAWAVCRRQAAASRPCQGSPVHLAQRTAPRPSHDFARIRVLAPTLLDGPKPKTPKTQPGLVTADVSKAIRTECDKQCAAKIGNTSYGETECELDQKGNPTGSVRVSVTDTDPCTKPCVELHEQTHAKRLGPVCKELHTCLKAAGTKWDAADKCWETFQNQTYALAPAMECDAYTAEAACMNDPKRKECTSKEAKARLAQRLSGVTCYRDCFCKGVANSRTRAQG